MNDMATSVGWTIVADPYGIITAQQNTVSVSEAVISFVEGEGSRMTAVSRKRTRQRVYNIAVVTGEPAGGTAPVYGIEYDSDPTSPTYYLGPFGRVPVFEKSQFVTTNAQAQAAAVGLLARKKGIGAALRITTWANPTLRPGDAAQVVRSKMGIDQTVPLSSMSISLVPGADMQVTTREGVIQ
jgi:hypothetical protein